MPSKCQGRTPNGARCETEACYFDSNHPQRQRTWCSICAPDHAIYKRVKTSVGATEEAAPIPSLQSLPIAVAYLPPPPQPLPYLEYQPRVESAPKVQGASSSIGTNTGTLEHGPTMAKCKEPVAFSAVLQELTIMPGKRINGDTKEIYIDYANFSTKVEVAVQDVGHSDPMTGQWRKAETRSPGFLKEVETLTNRSVARAKAHIVEAYGETRSLLLHAPSFLLDGDGGFIHQDAMLEYSCLMALVPGPPTEVYGRPMGEDNAAIAARALGVSHDDLVASCGYEYVRDCAPLLLPYPELAQSMKPAGGAKMCMAGDIAVLQPGCIHGTPKRRPGATATRAMLFFTLKPEGVQGNLYDPTHQLMSIDAWAKVVTHNFFPQQLTLHMDCLFGAVMAAAANDKFTGTKGKKAWTEFLNRVADYAPADNMKQAKNLVVALQQAVTQRDSAQKLAWIVCAT